MPTPLISDASRRAVADLARRRRRGLGGFGADMLQSHDLAIGSIAVGTFPAAVLAAPVTFRCTVSLGGTTPTGLVFEYGDGTTACALWFGTTTLTLRAGDTGDDSAAAVWTPSGGFVAGQRLELQAVAFPGTGAVRLYDRGLEVARAVAVNAELPNGWAAASAGSFGGAAAGALPADVTQTGAPSGFSVTSKLSCYAGQAPRGFA